MKLLWLLLTASTLIAQTAPLVVESAGGDAAAHVLRIEVTDVPALDLITKAAAVSAVPLKLEPGAMDVLARRTVTVHRERILLDELGLLLGLELALRVSFADASLTLGPAGSGAAAGASAALLHVEHALLGHAAQELMPPLRYQRACLLLASGDAEAATTAFADLIADFPGHSLSVDSRGLAITAALRAGRHDRALSFLGTTEESADGLLAALGADLLPARVHAASGNTKEALLRARRVASTGTLDRDRALAWLLVAELDYQAGDSRSMLAALDELPLDFDRTCRDLVPKVELARGLAVALQGDPRAALLHLRVALRSLKPESKATAARAISDCLAASGNPVEAWLAMREAVALETRPAVRRSVLVRCAEMEESLGFASHTIVTCAAILADAKGPFPEAERVLATLSRCFITTDRIDEARMALEALADCADWRGWASFKLASLELRAGDPERALRAVLRIEPGACKPPGPSHEEVRTMRGQILLEMGDPIQAADVFRGANEETPR